MAEAQELGAQVDLMNDGRSLTHRHRIVPGHRGGEYRDENVIEVHAVQCDKNTASHCMWHWANYFLWGDIKDRKAAEGLAGFKDREQIITEMISEGGKKGGAARGEQMRNMSPEDRKAHGDVLRKRMKGRLWWHNPSTGEHKRSRESPGPEFIKGRNQYTDEWKYKLGLAFKRRGDRTP